MIAYVDESKAKRFLFAVHLIEPKRQFVIRKELAKSLLAGQRSWHFVKESKRRRKHLIGLLLELGSKLVIIRVDSLNTVTKRTVALSALVDLITKYGISEIVFDLDQTSLSADSKYLSNFKFHLTWDHRERHQEPLLWVADAVAWCVNRGGDWERMVRPLIIETIVC